MHYIQTDVAIIGAGTAGLTAYRAVKKKAKRAVLIEGGPYGTMCARVGCMPSKLLIAAADAAYAIPHAKRFGIHVDGRTRVDGAQVMARVRRERDRFVGFVLDDMEAMPAQDKIRGYARFLSDTVLQVDDHTRVEAASIVIATGSTPVIPDVAQGLGDRLVVNDDVFSWNDLPRRLFVLGTGIIGLELGQALARLGVDVRVRGRSASLAGITDPDVKASALEAFQADFDLRLNALILSVRRVGNEVEVRYRDAGQNDVVERFDYLLAAAGRRPNIDHLELRNTSLALDARGMPVSFDPLTLQLGSAPIFMAGDVDTVLPLLHEAADDGYIAGGNAASYPKVRPGRRRAPLTVAFSDPQIAHAGARFKDLPGSGVAIGEVDFANQGRSRVILKNRGKLRIYADQHDGRFLGAEMAGPGAEHIGHLLAWAVQQKMTIAQMLAMPFYHPVIEEGLRTALRRTAAQLKLEAADAAHQLAREA